MLICLTWLINVAKASIDMFWNVGCQSLEKLRSQHEPCACVAVTYRCTLPQNDVAPRLLPVGAKNLRVKLVELKVLRLWDYYKADTYWARRVPFYSNTKFLGKKIQRQDHLLVFWCLELQSLGRMLSGSGLPSLITPEDNRNNNSIDSKQERFERGKADFLTNRTFICTLTF